MAGNSNATRLIRLTTEGGDRATAYGMSGKVVSLHEPYLLCSWLDVRRQNWWALVDAERGEVEVVYAGGVPLEAARRSISRALAGLPGVEAIERRGQPGKWVANRPAGHGERRVEPGGPQPGLTGQDGYVLRRSERGWKRISTSR